jgi:polysaccharide export outer membrane protein
MYRPDVIRAGSYFMKQFCSKLTVMLVTIAAAGLAQTAQQAPQKTTTPAPPSQPASSSPAPAGTQQPAILAPASPTAVEGPIDPARYVIGADDQLQITVWKEPTLSGTIPVRPDGMISLVLVGDLRAAGLTPMALSTDISQRLKKYIQDPVVTVVVLGVNSQRIFTVGEVGHVGPVMMTPGMTVLQAIVTAGGLTQFANSKHIYILRTVAGKQEKILFNYKQALKGENQGVALLPGDTIVVP